MANEDFFEDEQLSEDELEVLTAPEADVPAEPPAEGDPEDEKLEAADASVSEAEAHLVDLLEKGVPLSAINLITRSDGTLLRAEGPGEEG